MSALHRVLWSALPSLALLVRGPSAHAADIAAAPGGTSTNGFRALVTADRTSAPLLAPASREGEIRLKQFKHAPELKVDLWAAEPMLANPVAFTFDRKGRCFVAETFRLHAGVTDMRGHMDWLDDDLACRTVADRDRMYKNKLKDKVDEYGIHQMHPASLIATIGIVVACEQLARVVQRQFLRIP